MPGLSGLRQTSFCACLVSSPGRLFAHKPFVAVAANAAGDSVVAPQKSTPGKGKLFILAFVVIAIVAGFGFYWLHSEKTNRDSGSRAGTESTLTLDTFIVNLDSAGQRAYLRVGIALTASHLPHRSEDVPTAVLRDTILGVLSNAQPERLLAADGKQKLKAELLKELQDRVPELGIENVYFTEFLVQM